MWIVRKCYVVLQLLSIYILQNALKGIIQYKYLYVKYLDVYDCLKHIFVELYMCLKVGKDTQRRESVKES